MAFKVKLEKFEGTVEDLIRLVEKGKMDAGDVSVSEVTGQYLAHIKTKRELDMDAASNFLLAAARLASRKLAVLLPGEDKEEASDFEEEMDASEELARHLMEYKTYKEAAAYLRERLFSQGRIYGRQADFADYVHSISESSSLEGIRLGDLLSAFERVLKRREEEGRQEAVEIERQEYRVSDKIKELTRRLSGCRSGIDFNSLFTGGATKKEIIVTFLALLELVRLQKIKIRQEKSFGTIMIYPCFTGREVIDE